MCATSRHPHLFLVVLVIASHFKLSNQQELQSPQYDVNEQLIGLGLLDELPYSAEPKSLDINEASNTVDQSFGSQRGQVADSLRKPDDELPQSKLIDCVIQGIAGDRDQNDISTVYQLCELLLRRSYPLRVRRDTLKNSSSVNFIRILCCKKRFTGLTTPDISAQHNENSIDNIDNRVYSRALRFSENMMTPVKRKFHSWGGKRDVLYEENDKRKFHPWGGKRPSQPSGKVFTPWGGKRSEIPNSKAFTPWGGKRVSPQNDKPITTWADKRSSLPNGKAFTPWGGKRYSSLNDKAFNTEWYRKRLSVPNGKAFTPWGG